MEVQDKVERERQLVVFSLYGEAFGIEITKVREIIRPKELTRLPHTHDFIEGVTNLRGEVIPVIDLKKRFGIKAQETTDETRIIIVEVDSNRIGIVVDSVNEVLHLPESAIETVSRMFAGFKAEYLDGIGKVEDRLVILLDVDRILTSDEKIELQKAQKSEMEEAAR